MQRTDPRPMSDPAPDPLPDRAPAPPTRRIGGRLDPDQRAALSFIRAFAALGESLGRAVAPDLPVELRTNVSVATLVAIGQEGELRPIEIARILGYSSGGTTRVLDRLERGGFIRREFGTDPNDRRGSRVTLTDAGYGIVEAIAGGVMTNVALFEDVHRSIGALLDEARTSWAPGTADGATSERDH